MRYFLECDEDKKVVGWLVKNTAPVSKNLTEVEPLLFKERLLDIGITYELPEDKIERLEQEKKKLLEQVNMQDLAILDLANTISQISEKGEVQ